MMVRWQMDSAPRRPERFVLRRPLPRLAFETTSVRVRRHRVLPALPVPPRRDSHRRHRLWLRALLTHTAAGHPLPRPRDECRLRTVLTARVQVALDPVQPVRPTASNRLPGARPAASRYRLGPDTADAKACSSARSSNRRIYYLAPPTATFPLSKTLSAALSTACSPTMFAAKLPTMADQQMVTLIG